MCPVTGLPVIRRPEWTDVQLDDNYSVSTEIIGDRILHSQPKGYMTRDGVVRLASVQEEIINEGIAIGTPHVHLADCSGLKGVSRDARRKYSKNQLHRSDLAGLIFYGASPLIKLSIKLVSRFSFRPFPVEIVADYAAAVLRAPVLLGLSGTQEPGSPPAVPDTDGRPVPESGTIELDGYQLSYEVIDGHIIHIASKGFIGLREMERHLEIENMIIASLDRSCGNPVIVTDANQLVGITAGARRRYVAALRDRRKHDTIALLVCYGVRPFLRNAFSISRPFLPFRIRIARDRETALEIARHNMGSRILGPVDRLRSVFSQGAKAKRSTPPPDLDELLRLISNIDWEGDDPMEVESAMARDDSLAPVVDALKLIKADVDELFQARQSTEDALRESEERYRTILDSIVDGYYEVDLEGRLLMCNDSLLRIFGYARVDVQTLDAMTLMDDANRRVAIDTFRRVFDSGQPASSTNWEMLRKDQTPIIAESSISLVTDKDDKPIGFRGIIRDITERVRTAQEKANLEAQLQRSQRMEAIGTLAGGIAHNFNNLLMGIQGNISLLMREHSPDSPHVKRLTTVEALVDGGSKLTSQLLGYARSGRVDVRIVDLNALVLEIAETFSLTRREYRVHTELAASTMPAEVDATQIEQAVLNLLINAADAMPLGGDLYLGSRVVPHTELTDPEHEIKEGDHAVLSIRDTGVGMDRETLDRCFEPFFTTKGISGGTGLGLASAYGIVRANGGLIDVVSEVGNGTTFSLSFPMAGHGPESNLNVRGEPIEGVGTILVVEDDEAVLEACSEMLTHLHYTPICVTSGAAAIDIYTRRQNEIDLVILDLILTDLNGGEVFDRLRSIDPTARVLLASGYSLDGEAAGILDRGCNDFIQKPFSIEQLSRKLDGLLRRNN